VAKITRFPVKNALLWEIEPAYRNENSSQSPFCPAIDHFATPWREITERKNCGFLTIASECSDPLKQKIQ